MTLIKYSSIYLQSNKCYPKSDVTSNIQGGHILQYLPFLGNC